MVCWDWGSIFETLTKGLNIFPVWALDGDRKSNRLLNPVEGQFMPFVPSINCCSEGRWGQRMFSKNS